jgi:DNA-binding winged helix-turn-helix (wHTH) protein
VSADLPLLLLQQSDGGPTVVLGRALKPWLGRPLDRLLARRVLVELEPVGEWAPCTNCDQGCDGRVILRNVDHLIAACPYDSRSDEILNPDDRRAFSIDIENLCHAIREDTGLIGDDVAELADGVWLLGVLPRNGQTPRSVVLALRLQDRDAADLLFRIKSQFRLDTVVVTTATLSPPLRQQFLTADVPLVCIADALAANDPARPFSLDSQRLAAPAGLSGARLVICTAERSVEFDGQPVHLPPQPFDLLVLLARKAVAGRVRLQRRDIEDVLFGKAAHGHDVSDIVRRLRESLAPFVGGAVQAKQLIENKSRLGYHLNLQPAEIDLV